MTVGAPERPAVAVPSSTGNNSAAEPSGAAPTGRGGLLAHRLGHHIGGREVGGCGNDKEGADVLAHRADVRLMSSALL